MRLRTLERRLDAAHEEGRRDAIDIGSPNPGIPERRQHRAEVWAYAAGFAEGQREIEALRRRINPPTPRDPARTSP